MATETFDRNQLIMVSRMNMVQLASWVRKIVRGTGDRRGERIMDVIRGLQIALARYSHAVGKFDRVQDKMLAILSKLEKWLRLEYVRILTPEMIAKFPKLANDPTAIKHKVHAEWEQYFKRRSF